MRTLTVVLIAFLVVGCATPTARVSLAPSSSAEPSPAFTARPARSTAGTSPTPAPPTSNPAPALLGPLPAKALDKATAASLQAILDDSVAGGAPDAIAAVITADGTWAGAAGIDGPKQRLAKPEDEFGIASVSKTLLSALVLRLAERGKIDLDAPLAAYLDGMTVDTNGATVRQALAMRSGLGATVEGATAKALADCGRAWTRSEVLATIPAPFADAGTTFYSSNPTYKLLGYAAERVAGAQLAAALRTNVLDPVGSDRILLQGRGPATPKPWALPVAGHEGPLDVARYGTGGTLPCLGFSTLALGSSAMASDAPSLARWGWALFSGKVIDAESLEAMTTLEDGEHGLGIDRLFDFPGEVAYGHSGSQPGYAALLAVLPERQIVVVMFVNDEEQANVYRYAGRLLAALRT